MANPLVSVIWVNYNSAGIMDIVLESLEGILNNDYSPLELIVVDNGSTDRSFEIIKDYLERKRTLAQRVKILRLERNRGFVGAVNRGYAARSQEAKYVALLNNDAVPTKESIKAFVEFMEQNPSLGGVQGIISELYNENIVDTAGDFISELLTIHFAFNAKPVKSVTHCFYITYADGAYSLYSIRALKESLKNPDGLFPDIMFAYFDDIYLGLKLWNGGFKVVSIPIMAAKHRRSSTFRFVKPFQVYLGQRGLVTLNAITNSKLRSIAKILALRGTTPVACYGLSGISCRTLVYSIYRGLYTGRRLGSMLKNRGEEIDLYRAPVIRIPFLRAVGSIVAVRKLFEYIENELMPKYVRELRCEEF